MFKTIILIRLRTISRTFLNNKYMGSKEWTLSHPLAIQNKHYYYYMHSIYSVSDPTSFFIYFNNNNIIILLPI